MSTVIGDPLALYRMQVGAWVKNRMGRTPNCFQIPAKGLDIYVVRDFLSRGECEKVIALIDKDRVPSGLLSYNGDPEFRTSESCHLRLADRINVQVQDKINALTGIQPEHGETIQGQRYAPGQQFKPHHDFFHPNTEYWDAMQRTGGQRTWTAMIFLNDVEAGGQTWFPEANVRVTPRQGNLLVWNNMDEYGQPNPYSIHSGMPVEAGVKYIITKWYRERPWGAAPAKG
jgi:prolyl 4-hydroxylase